MIYYSLLNKNIKNEKFYLNQENIDKLNSYIIDKIDDIYFMSEYITFIFFYSGGGLLQIKFIDKLIEQNKYKKINIFIIDNIFYNLRKKIILNNYINKKNININCKIYSNIKDFYEYFIKNPCKIDFIIGVDKFYKKLNKLQFNYWIFFVNKLIGSRGVYDKDIYIIKNTNNELEINISSLYKLVN